MIHVELVDDQLLIEEETKEYRSQFYSLYDLMKHRVKEVLLVSSLYDDFILEEDGTLADALFEEYERLNLRNPPPRITRVGSAKEAINLLEKREFDLVITMQRVKDMHPFQFGQEIKEIHPDLPVILLLATFLDLPSLPKKDEQKGIDFVFTWSGDSALILAMIKLVEDRLNVEEDTKHGIVRVIIVVEDTVTFYSNFLPDIYKIVMRQNEQIIADSVNTSHRVLLRRARPKILLANTYEEAMTYYHKYKENVLGIITDVSYPRNGEIDENAGFHLIQAVRKHDPYLPIIIQSTDKQNKEKAQQYSVAFIDKTSPNMIHSLREFMAENMGLGPFVFRDENGNVYGKARTLHEFEEMILKVPAQSIVFHGSQNHFSNWLYARGEYELANRLRPLQIHDFTSVEEIREFLNQCFQELRMERRRGIVTEFSPATFDGLAPFTRVGTGSLGGKGRGLAFISYLLSRSKLLAKYQDKIEIDIPITIAIATDYFDEFIENNELVSLLDKDVTDDDVQRIFLSKPLPSKLHDILKLVISKIKGPIAIRSSSLMEDSQFQPFAGIYKTYMLPNNHNDDNVRLQQLETAIKLVYASTYTQLAKRYSESIGQNLEVEKMAVLIQKLVGKTYENRFYPHFSGVAQSINYYPIGRMEPEDGIANVALGLGITIVDEGKGLSFCPKYPNILPQFSSMKNALSNTQNTFYALDLSNQELNLEKGETSTLLSLPLTIAKKDKTLKWLGSVYDHQNDRIVDTLKQYGALLVTFAPILKYNRFPLAPLLQDILTLGKESFGTHVEIEFAVNLSDNPKKKHEFRLLQMRPLVYDYEAKEIEIDEYLPEAIIYTNQSLGNGIFKVHDLIYVKPQAFDRLKTKEIKEEVSSFNESFRKNNNEYILIGPGRWGTSDPFLGIPVKWNEIDHARAIVEVGLENFQVDPSQGMHFFVNVTSTKRGYLTVKYNDEQSFVKWGILEQQPVIKETRFLKHVRFKKPLEIRLNGKERKALIHENETNTAKSP